MHVSDQECFEGSNLKFRVNREISSQVPQFTRVEQGCTGSPLDQTIDLNSRIAGPRQKDLSWSAESNAKIYHLP